MLSGDRSCSQLKDFKFSDVTPLSLGTDIRGGIMKVIIPRNTLIPAEGQGIFTTVVNDQTCISSKILEGDRASVEDNNLLGEMYIDGIPPMPRGFPNIEYTFNVNADGILHVTAVEKSTGKKSEITISYDKKRLSKTDLERMAEDTEKFRLSDEKKRESIKAKNELESYCYDIQDEVEFNRKLSEPSKKKVLEKCAAIIEWLEAAPHEKDEYDMRKQELIEVFDSAE